MKDYWVKFYFDLVSSNHLYKSTLNRVAHMYVFFLLAGHKTFAKSQILHSYFHDYPFSFCEVMEIDVEKLHTVWGLIHSIILILAC